MTELSRADQLLSWSCFNLLQLVAQATSVRWTDALSLVIKVASSDVTEALLKSR